MSVSVRQSDRAVGGAVPGFALQHGDWLGCAESLAPGSIDMMYADPPFMTGRKLKDRAGSFEDSWATTGEYIRWLTARVRATIPALKPSACVMIHVDWRASHRVRVMLDDLFGEDRFINHLVWSYGLGGSSPRRFARKHDDILLYCVDPSRYYFEPPRVPATSRRMRGQMKKATDVLDIPALNNMAGERVGWPTQKPIALLEMLIGACCPPGGVVLDPCCGSGTTLVAAHRTGRKGIGFDVSPDAVALAYDRLGAQERSSC